MSLIQFPFVRNEYPGVGNPRFVSDIVAANQAVIDAIKVITGLGITDFAILSGMEYTSGSPTGSYSAGYFYLNNNIYYMGAAFSEGLYLAPNPQDIMPQPDSNGNQILIYKLLSGMSTSSPTGASPVFAGNMNAYRIDLKTMSNAVIAMQGVIQSLGNAAFKNTGNTSGTVAAGDDPRFGYTKAQIDNTFATITSVIQKGAGVSYTPTAAEDPVNKQYADRAAGAKLLWLGQVNSDGSSFTIAGSLTVTSARQGTGNYRLSHNFGSNNFFCTGMGVDDVATLSSPRSFIQQPGGSQFDVHVSDDASANDAACQIAMWSYF